MAKVFLMSHLIITGENYKLAPMIAFSQTPEEAKRLTRSILLRDYTFRRLESSVTEITPEIFKMAKAPMFAVASYISFEGGWSLRGSLVSCNSKELAIALVKAADPNVQASVAVKLASVTVTEMEEVLSNV